MFFNNSKNCQEILKSLDHIEKFINNEINAFDIPSNNCSGTNQQIMEKIIGISKLIQTKQQEDLTIYGEIMLCSEKLSDGFTEDRVTKITSNDKLNYIGKSINQMSEKLENNLTNIDETLTQYSQQNFTDKLNEEMFRGGKLKKLSQGINFLRGEITTNFQTTYRTSLVMQKESETLLENSSSLSNATMTQAASLEETAAAIEEITATISSNTKTATTMSSYGEEVKKSIQNGMNLTQKTLQAMNEINDSTSEVHEAINIIDQIAFQTNILSLNAAVEAATAGEAGKGFAVVAQEVRNLATRSAQAAKDIKDLVESASVKANEGKGIADKMTDGYNELNKNITNTIELIEQVVGASKEQENGISLINNSVSQIDTLTQQNANVAESVKMISKQMNKVANTNVEILNKVQFEGKDKLKIRESNYSQNYTGQERREDELY